MKKDNSVPNRSVKFYSSQ